MIKFSKEEAMKTIFVRSGLTGVLVFLVIVAAACGGAPVTETGKGVLEADTTEEVAVPPKEEAPSESEASTSASDINKIADAKQAIIQIEAQGSFVDPGMGQIYNNAGRGSGFIIDPSGLAVTNNHVVTGAALLKVWIGGDTSKTYNAKVLGVSECADLAVIDIEGEGFPSLSWYDGPIDVGTEIYVAGFPLGDPEYSLTKGIISKAKANGETGWASVDSVIEYDATTNPGNSGGPVLTPDAKIVGVHYAGNAQTRQAFGISREIAKGIVDKMKEGKDHESIGINGQAVSNEDGTLTGIWVSSVKSGSPADKAGIRGGDLMTTLEGLILATDQTLSDYCDILRSHAPTDTMNVEVLRFASGEFLEGQLNGRELAVTGVLSSDEQSSGGDTQADTSGGDAVDTGSPSGMLNLNASASGDYYYASDFDNLLTDWTYFLMSGTEDGANADIINSKLHIELQQPDTWVYFYLDPLYVADVRLDTVMENLGRNTNNVSLICRYTPGRGWYEFNVANDGLYTIFFYDEVDNQYRAIYTGGSTAIKTGKSVNEITAWCVGNKLSLSINGKDVRTVTHDRLTEGYVGLSLSSFNLTPVIGEFDYFIASVP
jgi:S1-C subfamily serine protease